MVFRAKHRIRGGDWTRLSLMGRVAVEWGHWRSRREK